MFFSFWCAAWESAGNLGSFFAAVRQSLHQCGLIWALLFRGMLIALEKA
jgi:hypothetical protein